MGQVNFNLPFLFYFLKSAQKLNNGTICLVVNKGRKIFQWIPKAGKGWVNWNLSAKNSTVVWSSFPSRGRSTFLPFFFPFLKSQ